MATRGSDTAQGLLRLIVENCSACHGSLDGHSYRFFACHPASIADAAVTAFLQAVEADDWVTVQASQKPALDQPLFVVYAIACPDPQSGGMVALLLTLPERLAPDRLFHQHALSPEKMAVLRAQCPTCPWLSFAPPLQFPQDSV